MGKMKRATTWEIGKKYYVICGIWRGRVAYVGEVRTGNRIKHEFTFGSLENCDEQFSIVSAKSNLRVYECGESPILDNGDITSSNE